MLVLQREPSRSDLTFGKLFVYGEPFCDTLEDEYRAVKVRGETRIPEGEYLIRLRTEGEMHQKYSHRFPFHRGMLWLQNVPGFEWVYIHVGNSDDDTMGCILVGYGRQGDLLTKSVAAYSDLYPMVAEEILTHGHASIIVR